MSHDNVYKGPFKNDKSISRHLAKSMALMEAADDYFCRIFELMTNKERPHNAYFEHLLTLFKNEIFHFLCLKQKYDAHCFGLDFRKDG